MPRKNSNLGRVQGICLSLTDAREMLTWGKPHFRVGDKIFCRYDDEAEEPTIGFKMEQEVAFAIVSDERFFRAPYVGQHGWFGMRARAIRAKDWPRVRAMIVDRYRMIAPRSMLAILDAPKSRAR